MICILARKKEIRTRRLHHVLQVSLAAMSLHIVVDTVHIQWVMLGWLAGYLP